MNKPIRILLFEDNPGDARLIREYFQEIPRTRYEVFLTENLANGFQMLQENIYDIILLDLGLPESQGLETFHKTHARFPSLPICILTGNEDDDLALRAVHLGAQDYLVKNRINAAILERVIRYSLERHQMLQEIQKINRTLKVLSHVNQTVIRASEEDTLIQNICRVAVEIGNYSLVWVGYLTPDGKRIEPRGSAGTNDGYTETIDLMCKNEQQESCPLCQALSSQQKLLIRDLEQDSPNETLRLQALRNNYHSLLVFPLQENNATFALLCIFSDEKDAFDEAEIDLLTELVEDLNYGIHAIRTDKESQKAKLRLQVSEAKYRALYENAPLSYQSLDQKGCFLDVNPTWLKTLGYERKEIIGKSFSYFLHPDWIPSFNENYLDFQKRGFVHDAEYKIRHKDGHYLDISFEGCIGYQPDGSFLQTYCVFQDITQRKRAERELRKSEELKRAIIDNSKDCIKLLELDGTLQFINEGGKNLLEIKDLNTVLNQSWIDFWKGEDHQKAKAAVAEARKGGIGYFDGFCPTASGKPKWWSILISPIFDEHGNVELLLSVSRDITIRKENEQERVRLQNQLSQSQKMEAVGQLAGGVAHDFNNILTVIKGNLDLLHYELDDAATLNRMEQIEKAADRAAALTRQLLTFSRKQEYKPEILELNNIVLDMEKMLKRLIGEDINFESRLSKNLPRIKADAGQVEQVLMNLVVNARDAVSENGQITISTELCEPEPGAEIDTSDSIAEQYVCLNVEDNGCGIDSENFSHIFEPFFTTKTANRGTGLGLSVVYGIIKKHDGFIKVTSEINKGTTFRIYFPAQSAKSVTSENRKARQVQSLGKGQRILHIEDEESIRDLVNLVMKRAGYRLCSACSGKEALDICREQKGQIDAAIIDVVLPDCSGLGLVEQILQIDPSIKILMTSGYLDDKSKTKFIQDKGYPFIRKPYNTQEFIETIDHLFDGS